MSLLFQNFLTRMTLLIQDDIPLKVPTAGQISFWKVADVRYFLNLTLSLFQGFENLEKIGDWQFRE